MTKDMLKRARQLARRLLRKKSTYKYTVDDLVFLLDLYGKILVKLKVIKHSKANAMRLDMLMRLLRMNIPLE